jgi:hypothetical protein
VNGEVVVDQGKLARVNLPDVIREANLIASQMLQTASLRTGIDYLKGIRGDA